MPEDHDQDPLEPGPVLVRGGIAVRHLRGFDLPSVVAALDRAEAEVGAPLVDEAERERLASPAAPDSWRPLVALKGRTPVGYAALMLSAACGSDGAVTASGDAAPLVADPARAVFGALLGALRTVAADAGVEELQVWVRNAGEREIDVAAVEELQVARRLGVLGRHLDDLPDLVEPSGHHVRTFRPGEDDDGVVAVLAAAYAGTDEAGWDLARFRERQSWSWFRAEDLLVAVDDRGGIGGLHWLKRRDETTGEVYNLAVHPDAQGHRLGPALLSAGLHHLADLGCERVVLWVDRSNGRAVRLYEGQGFTTLWDDIAFAAVLA